MPKPLILSDRENADVVRDERANRLNGPVDESEIRGHRADMWVGTGIHMPAHANGPQKSGRHRHHRHKRPNKRPGGELDEEDEKKKLLAPGQRVQFLLNQDDEIQGGEGGLETKRIFTEMVELHGTDAQQEWRQTARWVKFEEDVEEGGNRWSKPHVATLSLHSLFELRSCLLSGTVVLDLDATELVQVFDIMLDKMVASKQVDEEHRDAIRDALLRKHIHQYEQTRSGAKESNAAHGSSGGSTFLNTVRSIADIGRQFSHAKNLQHQDAGAPVDSQDPAHLKISKQQSSGGPSSGVSQLQLPKVASLPKDMTRESSTADATKGNVHFFKKLPPGAEASNVLIGQVEFLEHHISAFIRLKNAVLLGDLTEVPVPTRFIFVLLGPTGHGSQFREIGRAIATLMSDEIFHDVAYKAHNRTDLLDGVDEFLDQVTVLPPGEWDPNIRIEPPTSIPSQDKRKAQGKLPSDPSMKKDHDAEAGGGGGHEEGAGGDEAAAGGHGLDPTLKRTGRLFGGLIADVRRKLPFYVSEYTDALNMQCVAALMFMYFAMLAPIVTFGGLLEEATGKKMAAMENMLAGALCGSLYSIFAGQPLTMIGSTGPVLVFEKIIFQMCDGKLDYLALRWWINTWSSLILVIIVATDASALVSYITRFTEENFAVLISFIFVYECIKKTINIVGYAHTIAFHPNLPEHPSCSCSPKAAWNSTCYDLGINRSDCYRDYKFVKKNDIKYHYKGTERWLLDDSLDNRTYIDWTRIPLSYCEASNGTLSSYPWNDTGFLPDALAAPQDCYKMYDVFLMSVILTLGTFSIAFTLKKMRNGCYFPSKVRDVLSNFAVFIALVSMVLLDYFVGLDTPKLNVPATFQPTDSEHRGWFIHPFGGPDIVNPWWTALVALAPALLMCILLFMDHDITIVIVNRKENKLKKGCGYHLDLFVLAVGVFISGVLGLPIFVAATVMSISHVNALRVESECRAPGEKPSFIGVREQRVTGLLVFIMIGASVAMAKFLKLIPMPVLYGVFLYMGLSSLNGVQMIDRLLLFFIPMKYQPDYVYLRHVPIKRVHLFTVFQLACFIVLCVIKEIEITSIVFPIMLVVMVGVRKLMEYVFTKRELQYLDDPMPEITLRSKEDAKKKKEQLLAKEAEDDDQMATLGTVKTETNLHIPLASGNVMKIPLSSLEKPSGGGGHNPMNISEEMNRSSIWQHIASESSMGKDKENAVASNSKGGGEKKPRGGNAHLQSQKQTTTPAAPKVGHASQQPVHRASPDYADADDDFEPITIKIDRASPSPSTDRKLTEMQPLLDKGAGEQSQAAQQKARDEEDKRESAV